MHSVEEISKFLRMVKHNLTTEFYSTKKAEEVGITFRSKLTSAGSLLRRMLEFESELTRDIRRIGKT